MGQAEGSSFLNQSGCSGSCTNVDVGWIDPDNSDAEGPYNQLIRETVGEIRSYSGLLSNASQQQDDGPICRSTYHSPKWTCDYITAVFDSVTDPDDIKNVDGGGVRNLRKLPFDADCGDSGAPLARVTLSGGTAYYSWAGMHSDSSPNGPPGACGDSICQNCYSWYNTVNNIVTYSAIDELCYTTNC